MAAPTAAIWIAGDDDLHTLIELRAAWVDEPASVEYARAFEEWWARERDQRVTWLAEVSGGAVGMANMLVFTRMPRPDRVHSRWGYVANVFVPPAHRGHGIGTALVDAAVAYAQEHDLVRVVLSPSARSVPLYERAGFRADGSLMTRPGEPPG